MRVQEVMSPPQVSGLAWVGFGSYMNNRGGGGPYMSRVPPR